MTSLQPLRRQRPLPGKPTKLPMDRAILYACALLRFGFYYGDFIRWMGGEYTNRDKDWPSIFQTLVAVCNRPPPISLPPVDFQRGFRICSKGVPLKGDFDSSASALRS
jgi:hypothetical protein